MDNFEIISASEFREKIDKGKNEYFFDIRSKFYVIYKEALQKLNSQFILSSDISANEKIKIRETDYNKLELYKEIAYKMFTPKGYLVEIHQEKDEGDNFKEEFGFELNDLLINFIEPTYMIKVLVPNPYYDNY